MKLQGVSINDIFAAVGTVASGLKNGPKATDQGTLVDNKTQVSTMAIVGGVVGVVAVVGLVIYATKR